MNPPPPARRDPRISFEFFPPGSPAASHRLWQAVERLAPLAPEFVSVTYGAGGGTRERTLAAILAIRERARLSVAGHLTCVGASRHEVMQVARAYGKLGCRRIVALRGDPPGGTGRFEPHEEGFSGAAELVGALARIGGFEIWVAAYPEPHPDSLGPEADIDHLKRKLDAGACGAITQFFFENEVFLRFRDRCAAAGIAAPIVPGILPIEDYDKTLRFAARCGTAMPEWMDTAYTNAEDLDAVALLSTAICAEQCDGLIEEGVERLHLYTLNKPDLPYSVCQALGIAPQPIHQVAAGCG